MTQQLIGNTLQSLLKIHGDLSISELARETQIPQPTLHHIIEGKTKKPRRQALEALARYFSITVSQLTGAIPLMPTIPETIKDTLKISTVPVIEWSQAKHWRGRKDYPATNKEIIIEEMNEINLFALELSDGRLEPLFQEKSILIFDPVKIPKDRDFVLVYFPKKDTLELNRLFIDGKNYYIKYDSTDGNASLVKINPEYDKIIAVLLEARMRF